MGTSKFILLIDDDEDDRELFCEAIAEVDPDLLCKTIGDSTEAISYLKSTSRLPDYIFLDLNLPVLNGKQCLGEIKRIEKLKNIPVVIYTTSQMEEDISDTESLGAMFFIQKPSLFNEICDVISVALNKLNEL